MIVSRREWVAGAAGLAASMMPISGAQAASKPRPDDMEGLWGDQGDGTFINPILPADYSDIDAIRVGDDYYAISSTIHLSPGMVIMHSRDLVNWRTLGHAVPDIGVINKNLTSHVMGAYGKGVWAGALRYHAGLFRLYFASPNDGIYLTTAKEAKGPWSPLHQVWAISGYNDTCPFWDDDGQGYLVTSHFELDPTTNRKYNVHLFKLSADGQSLDMSSDKIIHQSNGSEANKLYKINGLYYHYYSEVKAEGRTAMMRRAPNLEGPWETRQLNHVDKLIDKEPNQGGFLEVGPDNWWFLSHQGRGDWEGRSLVLLPVVWQDGWPVIGEVGADGIGNMVWRARKPILGQPVSKPQTDDNFDIAQLGVQWEWNHQPRADKWSLTQRKGCLRLKAFKPLKGGDFLTVGNTLTQRVLRTRANEAVVRIDIAGMADGGSAGLCHVSRAHGLFGVVQDGTKRRLTYRSGVEVVSGLGVVYGPEVHQKDIWLRSLWNSEGDSRFSYSLDGRSFIEFGPSYRLSWGYYRGNRIGMYSFNTKAEAGYVDVLGFRYQYADQTGQFV